MRARLAVVVLAALALPASAQAHAFLESSTPANGTSLGRAPHVVSLHFTEPVSAGLAHVQLFDGRGRQRAGVRVRGGRTASELVVSLPALGTGAYRIAWSTVSQDDLHVTRGALVFGAGAAAPAIRASAGATPPTSLTESAAHLLDLVSLSILIAICGLLAGPLARSCASSRHPLRAGRSAGAAPRGHRGTRRQGIAAATARRPRPHRLGSRDGRARACRRRRRDRARSCAGHKSRSHCSYPSPQRKPRVGMPRRRAPLALGAMTLHILAAGLWVGGLIVLALVLPGAERRDVGETLPASAASPRPASAVLIVTGLYSAGLQVASPDALLSTTYGWSLTAKLALLAVTGGLGLLGLVSLRRARPSLRLLRAEAIGAVGILAAASLLLASAPARGPQFAPAPRPDRRHSARHGTGRRPPRGSLGRTQPAGAELRDRNDPRHAAPRRPDPCAGSWSPSHAVRTAWPRPPCGSTRTAGRSRARSSRLPAPGRSPSLPSVAACRTPCTPPSGLLLLP